MNRVMICLVGEQPVPNLLPIRHYRPQTAVLIHSERTKRVSENLEQLLREECSVLMLEIPPYNVEAATREIEQSLSEHGLRESNLIFNLTGGTKAMVLAAFQLAQEFHVPIVYLQSEGGQSDLHCYEWNSGRLAQRHPVTIRESLTIDDYLKAHVGRYGHRNKQDAYEQFVLHALQKHVDEIMSNVSIDPNIEIDLVIRRGNQVGIAEVTSGRANKGKIDQLHSVSGREFLGAYTKRFLIAHQELETNNRQLAQAYDITVIDGLGDLPDEQSKRLVETVVSRLGG